jgi:hypothetical protein
VLNYFFVLSIESWVSTFYQFCFLLMVLHDVIFNVTTKNLNLEYLKFFKKFYKFHTVGILSQGPRS